jgi:hypothetical protein
MNESYINIKKVKRSGIIPGTETAIIKMVFGIVCMIIGYISFMSGYTEYHFIAEANINILVNEILKDTTGLPPLSTLTDILNVAQTMTPHEQAQYFLDHRNAILKVLKHNNNLNEVQLENLNTILNHLNNMEAKILNTVNQINQTDLNAFIKDCKNLTKERKGK